MSENISLPAARVPMVDDKGMITREWMTLLAGMFRRVGGPVGFSNSELYGDAVALQSYDELLERISSLEANNRNLAQAIQMIGMGAWEQMAATPPAAITPDTFARIKVLGETDLAVSSGKVRVGMGVGGSNAKFQVGGDADVSGSASSSASMTAPEFRVGANKVVGPRAAGISAYTAYAGQTVGAAYEQAQAQSTDNAIKDASAKLAQVVTALRTHGLIGD